MGALERIEAARAVKILDGLFVARDPETGELLAIDLHSRGAGVSFAPLLLFRLEADERRRATERALSDRGAVTGETLRRLGETLEPGAALVALLLEHTWARPLDDAVARTDGTPLTNELVDSTTLSDLEPDLLAAASGAG